jgi:hypothetical protein
METESRTLLLSALLKIGPPPTRRCTGRERVDIMDVRVDLRQYCRNAYSHTIECRIGNSATPAKVLHSLWLSNKGLWIILKCNHLVRAKKSKYGHIVSTAACCLSMPQALVADKERARHACSLSTADLQGMAYCPTMPGTDFAKL